MPGATWRWPLLASVALGALPATRAAWSGLLGLEFKSDRPVESKSLHCPTGFITGIRIK